MPYFDVTTGLDGQGNPKATEAGGNGKRWKTAGFFGRLNYDYLGRYLAEINMRYDGSPVSVEEVAGNGLLHSL